MATLTTHEQQEIERANASGLQKSASKPWFQAGDEWLLRFPGRDALLPVSFGSRPGVSWHMALEQECDPLEAPGCNWERYHPLVAFCVGGKQTS